VSATFKLDIRDVEAGLRGLVRQGAKYRGALAELKSPLRKDQANHGRQMSGPSGKWKPRAQSTVLRARRSKSKKRVKGANRRLLASLPRRTILVQIRGHKLVAFSQVPWAGIHQYGGTAGHGAKIPARPFLWFSPEFLKLAKNKILDRTFRAWKGG
jgi:phage gpG-like protein